MDKKREYLWLFCVSSLFLLLHTIYVLQVNADVAYMDTLRYIVYYPSILKQKMQAIHYWNQGEHRGLFTQFALWVNIRVFGMNILLANVLTGFVLSALALILARQWFQVAPESNWISLAIVIFIYLAVFAPHGFELHTLDLGLPEISRNLFYVILVIWLLDSCARNSNRYYAGALLVVACMVFLSYGRIYAFMVALLSIVLLPRIVKWERGLAHFTRKEIAVIGSLCVGAVIFISMSKLIPSSVGSNASFKFDPASAYRCFGYAVSSALIGVEAAQKLYIFPWLLNCCGWIVAFVTLAASIRYAREIDHGAPVLPLFMAVYGVMNSIAVSVARGSAGIDAVMASRYYPDMSLLIVGVVWMLASLATCKPTGEGSLVGRRVWWGALSLVFVLWGLGYVATTMVEARAVPYRTLAFNEMRAITLSCSPLTKADADKLQTNSLAIAESAVRYQRELRLGPWRTSAKTCDLVTEKP